MPYLSFPLGPTGPGNIYILPTGSTGTVQQLTNIALADIDGIPFADPGYTGAVWCNGGNFQISKGT